MLPIFQKVEKTKMENDSTLAGFEKSYSNRVVFPGFPIMENWTDSACICGSILPP